MMVVEVRHTCFDRIVPGIVRLWFPAILLRSYRPHSPQVLIPNPSTINRERQLVHKGINSGEQAEH